MTKKLNRIISALLAFVMVFALGSFSAFADDETTDTTDTNETTGYTITIKDTNSGHTYVAYQIFTGDVSGSTLSNIEYGDGVTESTTEGQTAVSASDAAEYISTYIKGNTEDTTSYNGDEIIEYLEKNGIKLSGGTALAWDSTNNNYYTSVSSTGYYLIRDETATLSGNDSYTSYLIAIVGDSVSLDPKKDVPTVVKKVEEINDSTTDAGTYGDDADYDIDDVINFRLTGTLPTNYADYEKYYYVFHDVECEGLTFQKVTSVTIGEITVDPSCYVVLVRANDDTMKDDNCTFEVVFNDLNSLIDTDGKAITVAYGDEIVVNYTSKLNENAVIGSTGNDNKVHLEYSNNPSSSGAGKSTGTTPEDIVTVFTFELLVNKVDGDNSNAPLAGAGFTLYKLDASTGDYEIVGTEQKTEGSASFLFTGLDVGKYKLVETTTPPGYNTAADIYFEVVAEYELDTDQNDGSYKVSSLTIKDSEGNEISTGDDATFTTSTGSKSLTTSTDEDTGITTTSGTTTISTDVVNNTGTGLPETGGIGTKIFYTLGGILVVGAIVLLITKRRMKRA